MKRINGTSLFTGTGRRSSITSTPSLARRTAMSDRRRPTPGPIRRSSPNADAGDRSSKTPTPTTWSGRPGSRRCSPHCRRSEKSKHKKIMAELEIAPTRRPHSSPPLVGSAASATANAKHYSRSSTSPPDLVPQRPEVADVRTSVVCQHVRTASTVLPCDDRLRREQEQTSSCR